ncbi:MAG: prolyl oligopeptidase family serine peptidase, partial [bacterium]
KGVFFNTADLTLPDLHLDDALNAPMGIVVVNATTEAIPAGDLRITAPTDNQAGFLVDSSKFAWSIPPLSIRKVPIWLTQFNLLPDTTDVVLPLNLMRTQSLVTLDHAEITLRVRTADQTYKRTFISDIDESCQYYAVNPRTGDLPEGMNEPAIIFSLHGAGVEAIGQADALGPRDWADVVCPTNRRPYGFDWEDWGRQDAFEALADFRHGRTDHDVPIYLAGHSMGGHGSWYLGVTTPDMFDAVGPSAGWESFFTYAEKPRVEPLNRLAELVDRASNISDTALWLPNLTSKPVYILHGDVDDNVPVTEARAMKEQLTALGNTTFGYHEEPGMNHWWDIDHDKPGADCVDYAPMWEYMRHALPTEGAGNDDNYVTIDPAIWTGGPASKVLQQFEPEKPSSVNGGWAMRSYQADTKNVAWLLVKCSGMLAPDVPIRIALDGQEVSELPWPAHGYVDCRLNSNLKWEFAVDADEDLLWQKSPLHPGLFKRAFDHRFVLVYGTKGTSEENAWALAKARFDSEQWYYRGNGACDVIPDTAFIEATYPDCNVILYGNRDTNGAWWPLLDGLPFDVNAHHMPLPDDPLNGIVGDDLGGVFTYPRFSQSGTAIGNMVGVVGGTGIVGMRLTDRLRYFSAGVHYPDFMFLTPDTLQTMGSGIALAGYWGNDWSLTNGDWAMRE